MSIIGKWYKNIMAFHSHWKKALSRKLPAMWNYYYRLRYSLMSATYKYGRQNVAILLIVTTLLVFSALFYPYINNNLNLHWINQDNLHNLSALLLAIGTAIIGATVIAFAFIMFAMQINVERLPYGLFHRFSADMKLLLTFVITFILAITMACLSLLVTKSYAVNAMLIAIWCVIFVIMFLILAYKRALDLINPDFQLVTLIKDTKKRLNVWKKAADRSSTLLSNIQSYETSSDHDIGRVEYFQRFPDWNNVAQKALQYSFSVARFHAAQGDYDVSLSAMKAIIIINDTYIKTKGKTFFINPPFFDDPRSSDSIINNTLEQFRQYVQIAVARGDEQQTVQIFRAMEAICFLYLDIDYSTKSLAKTHAYLAVAYLTSIVESILPHKQTDVIMEGIRSMGKVSCYSVNKSDGNDIVNIVEKIKLICYVGIVEQKCSSVIPVCIEEMAKLTILLLSNGINNIDLIEKTHNHIGSIAEILLNKSSMTDRQKCDYLSKYYSISTPNALPEWLAQLVSTVLNPNTENDKRQIRIKNIKQWGESLCRTEKLLFLLAIDKRSHFTFDIMNWIAHNITIFLAVSTANCCSEYSQREIRKHATRLIYIFAQIVEQAQEDVIYFLENHQITELFFEMALEAHRRECEEMADKIRDLMLRWGFIAGKYQEGAHILRDVFYGLAYLNITFKLKDSVLLSDIKKMIEREDAPDIELRQNVADNIIRMAKQPPLDNIYTYSKSESRMTDMNDEKKHSILTKIANQLIFDIK